MNQSTVKGFATSLALVFITAVGAPAAYAHHVPATDDNAFSCKRDDLAAWKKKSAVEKIAQQEQLVEMTMPAQVYVIALDQNKNPHSSGSGGIVDGDKGYIITNHHVIDGAQGVSITTFDSKGQTIPGGTYDAKVIGSDPEADIALVQIIDKDVPKLPCFPIGDSSKIKVGQHVFALGNPFGLKSTVTSGIISALDRKSAFPGVSPVQDLIQIDAAVNSGNSGGPLINMDGEMIGTNTMIFTKLGEFNGTAFSVESNMSKNIAARLLKGEKITHGLLGVGVKDVTKEQAKAAGLKEPVGVIISGHDDPRTKQHVSGVAPGGPGEKAGLKEGDIIRKFGGHDVTNTEDLRFMVSNAPANLKTDIVVLRDGKELKLEITLGAMQAQQKADPRRGRPPGPGPFGGPGGPEGPEGGPEEGAPGIPPQGPYGGRPPVAPPQQQAPQQQAPQSQSGGGNIYNGPVFNGPIIIAPEALDKLQGLLQKSFSAPQQQALPAPSQPQQPQQAPRQQAPQEDGSPEIPPGFFGPGGEEGGEGEQPQADEGAPAPGPYGGGPQQQLPPGPFGPQ